MDSQYQAGMSPEYAAKIQQAAAQKAQYGDTCNGGTLGAYSPSETLQQEIAHRLQRESDNVSNLYRAQEILLRRPEFEELVWLIRSGLV